MVGTYTSVLSLIAPRGPKITGLANVDLILNILKRKKG